MNPNVKIPDNFIRVVVSPQQTGASLGATAAFLNLSHVIAIKEGGQSSEVKVSEETQKALSNLCFNVPGNVVKTITTDLRKDLSV